MLSLTTLDKGRGEIGHSFVGGFSFCLDDRKKQVFSQFVSTGFVRGVDACPEFMKRTISERKEFASIRGLCFGCLQRGHLSKDCKERKRCTVCNRQHPTPFHGDFRRREENTGDKQDSSKIPKANNSATCFMNGQGKTQANSMIVPVWLSHRNNSSNKRLVYALLDDQSDTTFITDTTLNHLGVSGPETNLLLLTMHATNELIKSRKTEVLWCRTSSAKSPCSYLKHFHVKSFQQRDPTFRDQSQRSSGPTWRRLQRRLYLIRAM